jgi:uncharacterized protein YkwD
MPRFDFARFRHGAIDRAGRGMTGLAAVAMLSLQAASVPETAPPTGTNPLHASGGAAAIAAPDPATLANEVEVLRLVNRHRAAGAKCGGTRYPAVAPLSMDANLRTAARLHSEDMAAASYFSHTSRDGRTFAHRIRNAGYTGWTSIGENIGAGYGSPQEVAQGWMASPGHCANIMSGRFDVVGIGYAFRSSAPPAGYWTQDFGSR